MHAEKSLPPECIWMHVVAYGMALLCLRAFVYVHICLSVQSWPNGPLALALLTENQ